MDYVLDTVDNTFDVMSTLLIPLNTIENIYFVLQQIYPCKSPGPNGTATLFFENFWDIVGFDMCSLF